MHCCPTLYIFFGLKTLYHFSANSHLCSYVGQGEICFVLNLLPGLSNLVFQSTPVDCDVAGVVCHLVAKQGTISLDNTMGVDHAHNTLVVTDCFVML